MKTLNKTLAVALTALALTAGGNAFAGAGKSTGGKCQASPLREAILSGALTDAELKTLEQDRDALRARYRALKQAGQPLDEASRAEMDKLRGALREKTRTLAENDVKCSARDALPASFCGARGGKAGKGGRMQPPAGLSAEQQAAWQKDRNTMRAKMQAARADGTVDAKERAELQTLRDEMQRKYHGAPAKP